MTNIFDLAAEIARLSPADDSNETSGYVGHEHKNGVDNVGWYTRGGNYGHSIFNIERADIPALLSRLTSLPDHAFVEGPSVHDRPEFAGLRIEWHV
jgi:hypothetical protein